jgi:LPS O-antigen subunit length determinant protein (WzzB/FepE family)
LLSRIRALSKFRLIIRIPPQAQQTNAALIGRLMDENATVGFTELRAIEKPSTPQAPIGPNRTAITGLGLSAGILMGAVVAWVRRPS